MGKIESFQLPNTKTFSDGSGCRVMGTGSGDFLISISRSWLLDIFETCVVDEPNETVASSKDVRVCDRAKLTCFGLKEFAVNDLKYSIRVLFLFSIFSFEIVERNETDYVYWDIFFLDFHEGREYPIYSHTQLRTSYPCSLGDINQSQFRLLSQHYGFVVETDQS